MQTDNHPIKRHHATKPSDDDAATTRDSLGVGLEQDLVFELLAFTQLQVEDEARDALKLLAEILHFQLSDLGVDKHQELPRAAEQDGVYFMNIISRFS